MTRSGVVTCANGDGPFSAYFYGGMYHLGSGLRCPRDVSQYVPRAGQAQTRLPKDSVS
jgi:hypothetical protein